MALVNPFRSASASRGLSLLRVVVGALPVLLAALPAQAQAPLFIENPEASANDGFGRALDVDGDVAIIGAPSEQTDGVWTGAAYVYRAQADGTWALEATLLPVTYDSFGDAQFGTDVAISGDVAAIAAPGEWINHGSGDANTKGAVYLYRRQGDGTWAFEAELYEEAFGDLLYATSLDLDGDLLAVGAAQWIVGPPGGGGGALTSTCSGGYERARLDLFRFDGAAWAAATTLVNPDSLIGTAFGSTVALDGGVLAAGAPYWYSPEYCTGSDTDGDGTVEGEERGRVFVFREGADGAWAFEQALEPATLQDRDQLGHDVAVSGNRIVAGAPYRDGVATRSGAAFSFVYDGTAWVEEAEFVGQDTNDGDYFGFAVDIEGDYAVVGAPIYTNGDLNLGATYGFQYADGAWEEGFRVTYDVDLSPSNPVPINFNFGSAVALDGSHVLIGAPEYGDYDGPDVAISIGAAFSYTLAEYFGLPSAPAALAARARPTSLPTDGGTIRFDVAVTNLTGASLPLDLWLEITGPVSAVRLLGQGTLPDGDVLHRSFPVRLPAATPNGVYTMTLHAGRRATAEVYAAQAFTITKGAGVTGVASRGAPGPDGLFLVTPQDWGAPEAFALAAPDAVAVYPNPVTDQATLAFEVAEAVEVRLSVYDVLGREVAVLVDGALEAGRHEAVLDARSLAAGAYVYRLTVGSDVRTGRLTVVR